MPAAKSAKRSPSAHELPTTPSATALRSLVDQLGERVDEADANAAALRGKKKLLDAEIRAHDREVEEIKAYLEKHLGRLQLDEVKGARFRAWIVANTRPTFSHECPADELPSALTRTKVSLDDAAALVAYNLNQLPPEVLATVGQHVRIALL